MTFIACGKCGLNAQWKELLCITCWLKNRESKVARKFDTEELIRKSIPLDPVMRDHYLSNTFENPIPFSWSQITTIEQCLLKLFFNYKMKYRKIIEAAVGAAPQLVHGRSFHKWAEYGFNNMHLDEITNEVIMFDKFEDDDGVTKSFKDEVPDYMWDDLMWLEDWMNSWYEEHGSIPKVELERKIKVPVERIHDVWIQKMGFIDMVWYFPPALDKDGNEITGKERVFLWDFKTSTDLTASGNTKGGVGKGLKQLYYYATIMIILGYDIMGIGLIYPEVQRFHIRMNQKVPKGAVNVSRIRAGTIEDKVIKKTGEVVRASIPQFVDDMILRVLTENVAPKYNPYLCDEWCIYAEENHCICDYEDMTPDLSKYKANITYEEIVELAVW